MSAQKRDQALFLKIVPQFPLELDVQSFLSDCTIRGLSPNTLRIYRNNLRAFQQWTECPDVTEVTTNHLRAYLKHLHDSGHNCGGIHQSYRVLKTFFRWLLAEGEIEHNPTERVKGPKLHDKPLDPLDMDTFKRLLSTCESKSFTDVRDKAILLALMDSGARASEFCALNVGDLNVSTGALLIRSGKGGKNRITFLGNKALKQTLRYLKKREDVSAETPLWVTVSGTRLTYSGLRQVVRRRADKVGIPEPGLHSFRRAFALMSLRAGMDVYSLQRLMGHSDLSVLRRYLAQTQEDLREAHQKAGIVDCLVKASISSRICPFSCLLACLYRFFIMRKYLYRSSIVIFSSVDIVPPVTLSNDRTIPLR